MAGPTASTTAARDQSSNEDHEENENTQSDVLPPTLHGKADEYDEGEASAAGDVPARRRPIWMCEHCARRGGGHDSERSHCTGGVGNIYWAGRAEAQPEE